MKVAETFDRETMMLPMGTASYLMWKAFRGSVIDVKRLFELVEQTSDLYQSCRGRFIRDIGVAAATPEAVLSCCDDNSSLVVIATQVIFVDGPSFVLARNPTAAETSSRWSADFDSRYCWSYVYFTELAVVVMCCTYAYIVLLCMSVFFIKVHIFAILKTRISLSGTAHAAQFYNNQ